MAYNMGQMMDPQAMLDLAKEAALAEAATDKVDEPVVVKADLGLPLMIGGGLILFWLMRK